MDEGRTDFPVDEPQHQRAGVWANQFEITYSRHEFTIDFERIDYRLGRGVLVARIATSPLLMSELKDAIDAIWSEYSKRAMPKEIDGDE